MHLALRHPDDAIMACHDDFLTLFRQAPQGCYFVTEQWIISGKNRKAALLDGLNRIFVEYYDDYGQRVDLAIGWLRQQGVLCERYTSRLLSESHYGKLPNGSVAHLAIAVGEAA
jgi:hypothetical protein